MIFSDKSLFASGQSKTAISFDVLAIINPQTNVGQHTKGAYNTSASSAALEGCELLELFSYSTIVSIYGWNCELRNYLEKKREPAILR